MRPKFKADAERKSEQYRKQLGLTVFDPLDAHHLAKLMDVPIFTVDDFPDLDPVHIAKLRDTDSFDAMWMPNEDGDKIIIHNNYHSPKRQQSNLMHELAHISEGHSIPVDKAKLCLLYGLHFYDKSQENEAKFLGGCLQITRPALLSAVNKGMTEIDISDQYNASVEMVRYRLFSSGVMKQKAYAAAKAR